MDSTRIRVENVDYYSFDENLKATPISEDGHLPKELNGYTEYLEHPIRKLPLCNLNVKISPSKLIDPKMESLLDYIRQKGFNGHKKPDFVTTKDLLRSVASMETNLIHVCRFNGIIFILKADRAIPEVFERIFENFMTKNHQNSMDLEEDSGRNGVFKASILKGEKEEWNIMYSGKIDAIQKTKKGNLRHYELKVTNGPVGGDYFYSENTCNHFWTMFFGGSPSMIIGSRTDKSPYQKRFSKEIVVKYPKLAVYEIKEIQRDSIPSTASELPYRFQWSVENGKKNIRDLLQLIKNHLRSDGDCFVFSRRPGGIKWEIKKDEKQVAPFYDMVKKYMTVFCHTGFYYNDLVFCESA